MLIIEKVNSFLFRHDGEVGSQVIKCESTELSIFEIWGSI
jgi:hypothetical protein